MSFNQREKIRRSIDTLQRLYAVIAGLAISEAVRRSFFNEPAPGEVHIDFSALPQFLAIIFTVIPFVHGMNRHIDDSLSITKTSKLRVALLFDFAIFMLEACVFFLLAVSVRARSDTLGPVKWLLALLVIDIVWAVATSLIRGAVAWSWPVINTVASLLLLVLMAVPFADPAWTFRILALIAVLRTAADYWWGREFYFPTPNQGMHPTAANGAAAGDT